MNPGKQDIQLIELSSGANEFAAHNVHDDDPTVEYLPGEQP